MCEEKDYPTSMPMMRRTLLRAKRLCPKVETYDKFLNRLLDVLEESVKR
jgi:hypothetical protein